MATIRNDVRGIWNGIHYRCGNPRAKAWPRYGGRGIKVCERWKNFENFVSDMGPRPAGTTLDRIDNDGDYTPENCRWATWSEQQRNRSNTTRLRLNGVTRTIPEWSQMLGISPATIAQRLRYGWSDERTLSEPVAPVPNSKLTATKVAAMRSMHRAGEGVATLAERFGVHVRTVYSVLAGRSWKHVP